MFHLTIGTMIEAPIQRVFDYMSMPENDFQWQYGTLATATLPNDAHGWASSFEALVI